MTFAELRARALAIFSRARAAQSMIELRASGGGSLDVEALLAKAVARERVSLELTVLAFEQGRRDSAGVVVKNRNGVRFRDGGLVALGRSGKGTPFLRDHRQYDSTARGGTVLESKTVKVVEGHYQILQTVELTEPSAVERALRGNMSAVSIGWNPTGPVNCTACGTEIFTECYHWPFDLAKSKDGETVEVEWEFTAAELWETSEVPIGGVPTAEIKDVRAALAATLSANPGLRPIPGREGNLPPGPGPEETQDMDPELLKLLGLAPTATLAEVLAAIGTMTAKLKDAGADKAELDIAAQRLAAFEGDIAKLNADKLKRDQDAFWRDALATGRVLKGEEETQRGFFELSPERAIAAMAKRPPNSATPVGAPPQTPPSAADPTTPIAAAGSRVQLVRAFREPLAGKGLAAVLGPQLLANPRAMQFAHVFGLEDDGRFALPSTLGPTAIANAADHATAKIGFHAAFLQSLEQSADDPTSLLFTPVPSNRSAEEWNFMGDLPGFEEWDGDRKLAVLKGFKLRVENKKWSNGLRVKSDDFKDDALGLLPSQVSGLALKARRHRWDLMVKLLLNGFDGSAYPEVGDGLAYDGAFFFSDSHLGGNDNKMAAALDATSLSAAGLQLESMLTLDGSDPMDIYGTHLIVGPKLRTIAEKLMTQERLANGEDNINRGKYQLIVSQRLRGAYDDYWFLADLSQAIKPLIFQMREEISTMETGPNGMPAFQQDELWFGAQARYNVGYFEPRLVVGSAV